MNDLKEGDLVKAWNDDPKSFVVGYLHDFTTIEEDGFLDISAFQVLYDECVDVFYNAVKIPEDLAGQLENLGA